MKTAAQIIDALGGSAAISRETGWALTTIESWKGANFIPDWRRRTLLDLASKRNAALGTTDFPIRAVAKREAA